MVTESELRDRFREGETPAGSIDVATVIRRARSRRRPRAIVAGGVSTLAAAAIVVPVAILGMGAPDRAAFDGTAVGGAAESSTLQDADGAESLERAPVTKLNLCEGAVSSPSGSTSDLVLALPSLEAPADGATLETEVLVVNASEDSIAGIVFAPPALTLARDGVVVWHSNGPRDAEPVAFDLGSGESLALPASFDAVSCASADEGREAFRPDLPAAEPGDYEISAVVEVRLADGGSLLVSGPPAPVRLG